MKLPAYLLALFLSTNLAIAQSYRPSGDIIAEGVQLYEDEDYKGALDKFNLVHPNDTNYAVALAEISLTYMALEEYEKAIEACDKGMALPYTVEPNFFVNKGSSLDELKRREEAFAVYEEGIVYFPRSATLYYNKALTLERMEHYQDALDGYYETLQINPLHAGTHARIGILAMNEGDFTLGMLALNTFLMLEPHTTRSLAYLGIYDEYMSGSTEPEPKGLPDEFKGLFNKSDLIVKNKVALNSKYKVKKPKDISFPFVKQNHATLSELTYNRREDNRWYQMYVPFWTELWEADMFEGFAYTAVVSVPDDALQNILNKKTKYIEEFLIWAKQAWIDKHKELKAEIMGEMMELPGYYYKNNNVQALGKRNTNGDLIGPWIFYTTDGSVTSEGAFNTQGKRIGKWTWYYATGLPEQEITFKNGEADGPFTDYFENGNVLRSGTYKKGQKDGMLKEYRYTGALESEGVYQEGKMEGKQSYYYPINVLAAEYELKEDKLDGTAKTYFDSGELKSEMHFKEGDLDGPYDVYYRDGSIDTKKAYKDDKQQGPYKEYFRNGQLYLEGTADEGKLVGMQVTYYRFGNKYQEIEFDELGKLKGVKRSYDWDGKLHYEWDYKKGEIVGYRYYNKDGKVIQEAKRSFNQFEFKGYAPDGTLDFAGNYKASEKDGVWKYYDEYGNLVSEETYDKGEIFGTAKSYYKNKAVRTERNYKDGELDGAFTEYFSNGAVASESYYEMGKQVGPQKDYYPDGTLKSERYYRDDDLDGWQSFYDVAGRLTEKDFYDHSIFFGTVLYDTLGQERERMMLENGTGTFIVHHSNGQEARRIEYLNGQAHGDAVWKNANGQISTKGSYFNGDRHGAWEWYFDNGQMSQKGEYYYGAPVGKWLKYHRNGKLSEEFTSEYGVLAGEDKNYYEEGGPSSTYTYQDDEIHGKRYFYNLAGDVTMVRFYDKGKIIGYSYETANGELKDMIKVKKGNVSITTYYRNGQKAVEFAIKNGYFQGPYKKYYKDGTLWSEINYVDDDRSGNSKEYYPDGTVKEEHNYFYNLPHGRQTTYYPNGKVKSVKNYRMDKLHGKVIEYNKDGTVKSENLYYDGELIK